MIDVQYGFQVLAWAIVWSVAGLSVREWLAEQDEQRERQR